MDDNGVFTDASYQQNLTDTFSNEYFSANLDLHNSPPVAGIFKYR